MTNHRQRLIFVFITLLLSVLSAAFPFPGLAAESSYFTLDATPLALSSEMQLAAADPDRSAPQVGLIAQASQGPVTPTATPAQQSLLGRRPLRQGSWEAGAFLAYSISGAGGPKADPIVRAFWLIPRIGYTFWEIPWYPASLQVYLEPTAAFITSPTKTYLLGVSIILRHTFLVWRRVSPYVEGGAGLLNTNLRHRALGESIEFMPQFGGGFHVHIFERLSLNAGYRWHHISNAGLAERNLGLNSHFPYGGFTYFF